MRPALPVSLRLVGATLVLAVLAVPALAQIEEAQRVVGSGGTDMKSTSYSVRGTIGQANIGTTAGGSNEGKIGYWYLPYTIVTAIDDIPGLPRTHALDQNYPNPFNPTTTIKFALPRESFVKLRVYDVQGRLVAVLVNEERPAGYYEVSFNASPLASGVYFYRIETPSFVQSRKLVLMK